MAALINRNIQSASALFRKGMLTGAMALNKPLRCFANVTLVQLERPNKISFRLYLKLRLMCTFSVCYVTATYI